jgi:hypothetical protein
MENLRGTRNRPWCFVLECNRHNKGDKSYTLLRKASDIESMFTVPCLLDAAAFFLSVLCFVSSFFSTLFHSFIHSFIRSIFLLLYRYFFPSFFLSFFLLFFLSFFLSVFVLVWFGATNTQWKNNGKKYQLSWGPMWATGCSWWVVVVLICRI